MISAVSVGLLSWSTDAFSLTGTGTSTGRHGHLCLGASCRDPLAVNPNDSARQPKELLTDLYTATTEIGTGSFGVVFKVSVRAIYPRDVALLWFNTCLLQVQDDFCYAYIAQPKNKYTEHNTVVTTVNGRIRRKLMGHPVTIFL